MNVRTLAPVAGLAVLIVAVLLLLGSGPAPYRVYATLADADGLLSGSRVEIGGVSVGTVQSLAITRQDHARVIFTVARADAPLGRNASLVVRPADLLGEKYIDLSTGNRTDPAPSGFSIPLARTQEATDYDQFVNMFAPTVRDRLAILIHETGVALFGRGADVAALLSALPPSLSDARQMINQVDSSNAQLRGFIDHSSAVMATLAADQTALGRFVATGAQAMTASTANPAGVSQSIAETPGLLTQLDTTLGRLTAAGQQLRPAARGLIHTAPALTATLHALPAFTAAALPSLAETRAIAPQLTGLGRQVAPVIARLKPTTQELASFAAANASNLQTLNGSIGNLLGTLQNWSRAIQDGDSLGHQFRVSVEFTPTEIKELLPIISGLPIPARRHRTTGRTRALGRVANPVTRPVRSLPSPAGSLLHSVSGGLSSTLSTIASGLSSVTGSGHTAASAPSASSTTTSSQAPGLLSYLLGGGR